MYYIFNHAIIQTQAKVTFLIQVKQWGQLQTGQTDIQTPQTIRSLPGKSDLSLLPGNVGCLLCCLHGSIYLLSDLTGTEGNQVLPFAAHQDVLFVLSFFLCAIRKCGTAIAMTFVAKPLPFVLQSIRPSTHTKSCPLVILPLPTVRLCCCSIHIIISYSQLCICISKTEKIKVEINLAGVLNRKSPIYL